jgi:hypothetical protein
MLRFLKPMPENAKTLPVQRLSKALEAILAYQAMSNVEATRTLDRQPEVDCQIKPHNLSALLVTCISELHERWISSVVFVSAS